MKIDNSLTTCTIPECIRKIAIPASVGFFFHTLFNVVDTYYAGLIGTTAQAALSLAFPVFFVVISVGSGVQVGTTALIGAALGSGDNRAAGEYARQGLGFGLTVTVLLTLVGLVGARPLFSILGAQGDYLAACLQYMLPIFALCIFPLLIYVFNAVLQSQGDTKSFRNVLMASSAANIALDPWFIYGGWGLPAMGITGIAVATILCQAGGTFYLGLRAVRTGIYSVPGSGGWRPRATPFRDLARQSLPAGFNYVTMGLGIFIITYFVSRFGQTVVAAYGVATRVEQIVLMPTIGLNIATLTLTAQNHGAGKLDRVHELMRKSLTYGAWLMGGGGILVFATAEPLMRAFTADPLVQAEGVRFLRIMAFLLYAYVVLFVSVAMLQGLKRPMFALWIGLWRQIAAPVALFWVLTGLLDFGVAAIWWSIVAINSSAALYSWTYARRVLSRLTPRP
ncbi:MAG: MATE family efflux transporter [Proteobacteria bacterium]|nr:MATE family efflux transporter [Pseudomonadota bacterium]